MDANTNVMQPRVPITVVKNEDGTIDLRTLAGRTRWAREQRKLSQAALAERAHVSQGTIGNIESGHRKKPRELLAISRALYCSAEWLETGRGEWDTAKGSAGVQEKGAVYNVPNTDERGMLELWRRMSPSDRKLMLVEMAEKAERYQQDMQQSLDEAGVKLPFPLTSPVSADATRRAQTSRSTVTATGQRELPLAQTAGRRK